MNGPDQQPDELGALKVVVGEFVRRLKAIEGELDLLKESKKDLVDEFKEKLDTTTLNQALRAVKIRKKAKYMDTFDAFVGILETYETVD